MAKIAKPQLTIVIPTYNEERDLPSCLASIEQQTVPTSTFEVIIVDNYSKDRTLEIARDFAQRMNVSIIMNKVKDAEVSKRKGMAKAKGELFMYLDADMRFADREFIKKMIYPFKHDKRIAGNFVQFKVNKSHHPLTRTLSYDVFQRDPIFTFFTVGIEDIVHQKNEKYWLCFCKHDNVPPQGLMVYRKSLIQDYLKNQRQLIDNEIPAILVEKGHHYFAFVPSTGVEHFLLRTLRELSHKRRRNLQRTYYPNQQTRKFRWINWKKDWPKVILWMIYTNSFIAPITVALIKAFKTKDICFLNEPAINFVSTYSIIFGVLSGFVRK